MENNEVINHIIEEILNSDELTEKLKSLNNLDEIYSFYKSIDERLSEEDFNDYLSDLIPLIENSKTLDEHLLNQVAGGVKTRKFDKTLAALLGSLALASPMSSNALTSEKTKPINTTSTQEKFSTKKKLGIAAAIGIPTVGALLLGTGNLISNHIHQNNTVLVIGGDEQSRDALVEDIKNNKNEIGDDISTMLTRGGNYTDGISAWRAKFSNWNIKKINANDENLEELLKSAMMAIVIVTDKKEAKEIDEKIDRITTTRTKTGATRSKCLVVCVADEMSPDVKQEIDNEREKCRPNFTGEDIEKYIRSWELPIQQGKKRLMVDVGYIWDRKNGEYFCNRYST